MYSVVKNCVRYNGRFSEYINSHIGVKQGDASSPMLFMMSINDVIQCVNDDLKGFFTVKDIRLFLLLYADDQVI